MIHFFVGFSHFMYLSIKILLARDIIQILENWASRPTLKFGQKFELGVLVLVSIPTLLFIVWAEIGQVSYKFIFNLIFLFFLFINQLKRNCNWGFMIWLQGRKFLESSTTSGLIKDKNWGNWRRRWESFRVGLSWVRL